ncbi:MAG: tetratricopeptide repeat protein [Candidatus Eisenbacteria bacterium]|nr:tetratricopeptide repeat protein [Candidatus Eisenbacteria bacterium]
MIRRAPLYLLLLLFASGCAYFNTFYHARKYYNQAAESQRKSGLERASPGEANLYNKSLEKCTKVITQYPKSRWVDDAAYLMGLCYFARGEYDKAQEKFEEIPLAYPKSNLVPDCHLMKGKCLFKKKVHDQAEVVLLSTLSDYPRINHRDDLLFTLGENSLATKENEKALQWFTRVYKEETGSKRRYDALIKIGEVDYLLKRFDEAKEAFTIVSLRHPLADKRFEARYKIGDCLEAIGKFQEGLQFYQDMLKEVKGGVKEAEVTIRIGRSYERLADAKKAIEIYNQVMDKFPKSAFAAEAQFRVGYTYEILLEDLDKARESYDKVKTIYSRSQFVEQAGTRSSNIAKWGEYKKESKDEGGEKAAEKAFMLAELLFFQLDKVDKALEQYALVERDYPGSSFAPRAAFATAWILKNVKKDEQGSKEAFLRVTEMYPNTPFAEAAAKALEEHFEADSTLKSPDPNDRQ